MKKIKILPYQVARYRFARTCFSPYQGKAIPLEQAEAFGMAKVKKYEEKHSSFYLVEYPPDKGEPIFCIAPDEGWPESLNKVISIICEKNQIEDRELARKAFALLYTGLYLKIKEIERIRKM